MDCSIKRSLLAAAIFLAPLVARAQVLNATIDGNVTDSTQALVVGAKVTATNQETNATREETSNSSGAYTFSAMPPGTYTITVTASGFQTYTQRNIQVSPNTVARVDVSLTLGAVAQNVTVEAEAAALQTDRSDVRSEIGGNTLNNIPVAGRNYQNAFVVLPGVSPPQTSHSYAANPKRGDFFTTNGVANNINATQIDGAISGSVVDNDLSSLYIPAMEAIQEVNIVTNSFDAEQGLAGGAAVNVLIKSGSNAVHGSMFEYHTDQHLMAYAWGTNQSQPNPKYVFNQFGGTIGGPILKNRLFYFLSFEGDTTVQDATIYEEVPTAAMRTGNLSASPTPIYDPTTGNPNGTGRTPFGGNIIPMSRIDPGVLNLLNLNIWPSPNQPGTGALGLSRNFYTTGPSSLLLGQYDDKLTWNVTSKLTVNVRYGFIDHGSYSGGAFGGLGGDPVSAVNTAIGSQGGNIFNGSTSATYILSPNWIVDGYFGESKEDSYVVQPGLDQNPGWTVLQVPGLQTNIAREMGWPHVQIDGFGQLGPPNNFSPYHYYDPNQVIAANSSFNKGAHNIRFGVSFNFQSLNEDILFGSISYGAGSGGFHFSQGQTQLNGGPAGNDYNAFASFLLGFTSDEGKLHLFPNQAQARTKEYGAYIGDRWQVTPKLTVNYGIRYEYFPFPTRVGRGLEAYNFNNNTLNICGLGPNPLDCGIGRGRGIPAPRAGIAYRINDGMVVRAGYGITNDPINLATYQRLNYPDLNQYLVDAPNAYTTAGTLRQGVPVPVAPDLTSGVISVPANVALLTMDKNNLDRGYIQSWNLIMEKRFGSWIASAGYVANRAVNQGAALNQNWSPIGGGVAGEQLNVKFGRTAVTNLFGSLGTAKYDSLQVQAQHRLANHYTVAVSYTYGHSRGYTSQADGAAPLIGIPYLYNLNYGNTDQDIRHNLGVTWLIDLPFGKGQRWAANGPAAYILGGWQLSSVFTAHTGLPFTPLGPITSLNAPGSTERANCLASPQKLGNIYQWYNRADFGVPAPGTIGSCGNYSVSEPGLINMDLSVERNWKLSERFGLKFRTEMFNVANTPFLTIPSANFNVTSGSFLQATALQNIGRDGLDQRLFRLSMRLAW